MDFSAGFGVGAIVSPIIINFFNKIFDILFHKKKFRFEKLHIEQADVIKIVYQKIILTQRLFESLMRPVQFAGEVSRNQKAIEASESANDLFEYVECHAIYFDDILEEDLNKLTKKIRDYFIQFNFEQDLPQGKEKIDIWGQTWDQVRLEMPPLINVLKKQFREYLGLI